MRCDDKDEKCRTDFQSVHQNGRIGNPSYNRMKLLDLTLDTAAENIALDEALLAAAEHSDSPREVLRLWESPDPMVVIGRSSQVDVEVDREICRRRGIPVFRRTTGGAAIVAGPGCYMYAVVLSYELHPHLQNISAAHCFVLNTLVRALTNLVPQAKIQGISDLAVDGMKFSGNSMRCGRSHLLYHGTILYAFDISLVSSCLRSPPRQPDYRQGRNHREFVQNVTLDCDRLREAMVETWQANDPLSDWPRGMIEPLVADKYSKNEWNLRR